MKKNLIPSFLLWLLAEIIFIVMFAFSGSAVAAVLFFTMLLISLVSYLICVFSGKYFSAAIKLPASVKKSAALSNPDVLAFNILGKQTVENINKLAGYYIKVSTADPEMGEKMKEYLLKLSAAIRVKAEGKKAE